MRASEKKSAWCFSRFGALVILFYLPFTLALRFLLPFGDEPDFSVVAHQLINGATEEWWSPYYWLMPLLEGISIASSCMPVAGAMSLWAYIDVSLCAEDAGQSFVRFLLNILITTPFLLLITYRIYFFRFIFLWGREVSLEEWNKRLNVLGLSLLFPGMGYYLGVLSVNQFTLLLSLFVFVCWGNWPLVTCLVVLISFFDFGNAIVVLQFLTFAWLSLSVNKYFSTKSSFLTLLFFIFFAFFAGYSFLPYFEAVPLLSDKASAMMLKNQNNYFIEKYPVIFRPLIAFMTGVFMTPAGVKVVLIYILVGLCGAIAIRRIHLKFSHARAHRAVLVSQTLQVFTKEIVVAASALTTVLFFVFLFPDYGNAKYYIFLLPFMLAPVLQVIPKFNVLVAFCCFYLLLLLHLVLYRI